MRLFSYRNGSTTSRSTPCTWPRLLPPPSRAVTSSCMHLFLNLGYAFYSPFCTMATFSCPLDLGGTQKLGPFSNTHNTFRGPKQTTAAAHSAFVLAWRKPLHWCHMNSAILFASRIRCLYFAPHWPFPLPGKYSFLLLGVCLVVSSSFSKIVLRHSNVETLRCACFSLRFF